VAMDSEQKQEFAELRRSELKTARAWALKETAMASTTTCMTDQHESISIGGTTGRYEVGCIR